MGSHDHRARPNAADEHRFGVSNSLNSASCKKEAEKGKHSKKIIAVARIICQSYKFKRSI